jgi:hypothetical protein
LCQWLAPEVCAGGVPTTASDVYMVGGLAYELLTAGVPPFHWLAGDLESELLLGRRRASAGRVPLPGLRSGLPGLLGRSVLEAAVEDGEAIPWCVRTGGALDGPGALGALHQLVAQCLAGDASARPLVPALHSALEALVVEAHREEAEGGVRPPCVQGVGSRGSSTPGYTTESESVAGSAGSMPTSPLPGTPPTTALAPFVLGPGRVVAIVAGHVRPRYVCVCVCL